MKRLITLLALFFYISLAFSEEIDVPAGEYALNELRPDVTGVVFTIVEIDDTDPYYAPAASLLFYTEDGTVELTIGIRKLDGSQGLVAYFALGSPNNLSAIKTVKSNLLMNTEYEIRFFNSRPGRLVAGINEEVFAINTNFEAVKIEQMIWLQTC